MTQPDLFGELDAAEALAASAALGLKRDALTMLIDSHPNTLDLLIGTRRRDTGEIKQGKSGNWAYSVRNPGIYFEREDTWGGWYARPAHLLTWDNFDALVADDPRLDAVRAWASSLTAVDAWKDRYRPFELWPDPERWHPSYIEGDHARPGWESRKAAWDTVLTVLRDAREALS